MRRTSRKMERALREYRRDRVLFLVANPLCERCQAARSVDVHHKAGRGQRLNDQALWCALCRPCHARVTLYPAEAYEQGWSIRRNGGSDAA